MAGKYENILETVGRTPVVRINRMAPEGVNLFVKVESFNPMGSIKDRLALGVIRDAERKGVLTPGQTVIEATSGNTGIGLAMVCAQRGYPLVVTMAENFSVERRKMMRFLGAKVVLTPATERGTGMLAKAVELADTHGWFLCRQFENEANADVHSETTAQEILADFEGERLDYWVTGFGTGGTLKGVARVLKESRTDTQVVVCEPDNSRILASGTPQPRDAVGTPTGSHPAFNTHPMQGWSPDFIPKLAEDASDQEWVDQAIGVSGADAMRVSRELAQKEGIFVGISSGATLAGALQLCESARPGTTVLCMLPDTGERYLTTPLFDDVSTEMSPEEIEISQSSPSFRFDVDGTGGPASIEAVATPEAEAFVESTVNDASRKVVMFALEWCEFCWAVRRLFAAAAIEYRSVDFDSAEMETAGWGGAVRSALAARTSSRTVPQVFVGGEFVGGCVDVIEAHTDGRLQTLLRKHGVEFDDDTGVDARGFLPNWLQPR